MLTGILDKLVFAGVLLTLFQLPILASHYHQYLQGYVDANEQQIAQYQQLALQYHYPSLEAMLAEHQQNTVESVRADATLKSQQLVALQELKAGLTIFEHGSLWQQTHYMLQPAQYPQLVSVLRNFAPGIPLNPEYLGLCLLAALCFNLIAAAPWQLRRQYRTQKHTKNPTSSYP
jgi:hypothetical protein